MSDDHTRHYSSREYTGCPHCGGPVNISVEVNAALASLASAFVPLLPDKAARKLADRAALSYANLAKIAEEDGDTTLGTLRELAEESEQKTRSGKVARRRRA